MTRTKKTHDDYTVGWMVAIQCELDAARALLDEEHEPLKPKEKDDNAYLLGQMEGHNVVIACPAEYGTTAAAQTATNMLRTFPHIRFGLMVGVGGGAPNPHPQDPKKDIRLGDVVVSEPKGSHGGVIQYDRGKETDDDFDIQTHLNKPPGILLKAVHALQSDHRFKKDKMKKYMADVIAKAEELPDFEGCHFPGRDQDHLFEADYHHVTVEDREDCAACELRRTVRRGDRRSDDPVVHLGLIASANRVIRSAKHREQLRKAWNVSCFEMEAAGLMNDFPCIIIRGICDYSDDHKNKSWQPYAAVAAAAYAKDLLRIVQPEEVEDVKRAAEVTNSQPKASNHPETTGKTSHLREGYCFLGQANVDLVDKVMASKGDSFRHDLQGLMATMVNCADLRDPAIYFQYLQCMDRYGLASYWHGSGSVTLFNGYNKEATNVRYNQQYSNYERLRARRAFNFIQSNGSGNGSAYVMLDTVVRLWQYVNGIPPK